MNRELYPLPADTYDRMVTEGYDMSAWTRVEGQPQPKSDQPVRYLNREARRADERAARKARRS